MNIKYFVLLCLLLTFFNIESYAQQKDKVTKIVIDAGHGGGDPGCLGKKSKEKDVNLKVALKLGKLISDNYDDVQVIYTRKTDVAVELYKRAQLANNNQADLFISIHCNAAENKSAHGVETYVMGLHKSEDNLAIAKKENAAILKEKNYENNYEGFDPNSPEADIIFSLYTSAYLKNSILLADKVQKHLVVNTKLVDKKVKQAGFWVLYKVAMPSILIELGFLSNATEEEYMIQEHSQDIMAVSIYNAFVEYKNHVEKTNKPLLPVPKKGATNTQTTPVASQTNDKPEKPIQNNTGTSAEKPVANNNNHGISFRVQFFATPENISVTDKKFRSLPQVKKYFENNLWKYTSGDEFSFEAIQAVLTTVRKQYPDAFVIAFRNDEKIPVSKARELSKK